MKINKMKLTLLSVSFAFVVGGVAEAARVDATLSWEDVKYDKHEDYGKYRDYRGPRVEAIINPDNTNWRIYFRWNQNRSNGYINNSGALVSQRDYQRLDIGLGYRYRFQDSWFEPRFYTRQYKTININGTNTTNDSYAFELYYNYNLSPRWVLNGQIKPAITKSEGSRTYLSNANATTRANHMRKTVFGWEIEQGLRYIINPDWNVEVAYNDTRSRQDDDASSFNWEDATLTRSNPQLRIYTNYKTSFGLTFSPYIRKSIFGKVKYKRESTGEYAVGDFTRYALRVQYQINNHFALTGEYYKDKTKSDAGTSRNDYLRLGVRVIF